MQTPFLMNYPAKESRVHTDLEKICSAIESGMLLLTPNQRMAAEWHQQYANFQQKNNRAAYPTPDIYPLNAWLQSLYDRVAVNQTQQPPLVLNNTLSHYLFESIVQSTTDETPLLQPSRTAKLLQSAYSTLKQWRIPLTDPHLIQTPEDQRANAWMARYESLCKQNQWMDAANLIDWLIERWSEVTALLPSHFLLFGFNELTPQQQYLFTLINHHAQAMLPPTTETQASPSYQLNFESELTEWDTVARFVSDYHDKHPEARIGIVVPDLENKRDRLHHHFKYYIDESHFNISAGKRLADFPIIHAAIQCLNLYHGHLDNEAFSYLMNTPFIAGSESEQCGRARLDALRRENNLTHLHLRQLSPQQSTWFQQHAPKLYEHIHAFYTHVQTIKKQNLSAWANTFNQLLTLLGWPGERILNSDEYQVVQAWLRVLAELQTLETIAGAVSLSEALHSLTLIAHQTVFQAKTPDAPIQLLGVLEAAGLQFDVIWVMGLDHTNWPPAPQPNPFIPRRLQREKNMPHATAERELMYCRDLMNQFYKHAPLSYFSYAKIKDDTPREASGLIKHLPLMTLTEDSLAPRQHEHVQPVILETYRDDLAPPIDAVKLSGGVHLIKLQAQCPFKAFAECRLEAKALPEPQPGLTAKDRGILLHSALESFWQKTETQAALLAYTPQALTAVVNEAIDIAFNSINLPYARDTKYMQLEHSRMNTLMLDWLTLEKKRPRFRVLTHEKSVSLPLASMTLSARIDRIDELETGNKLIIDYKTGTRDQPSTWFEARPDQPQLPLYTLLDMEKTEAISFGQVAAGRCVFKGVSDTDTGIAGITPFAKINNPAKETTWAQQLKAWQSTFTQLAKDHAAGAAHVDPKHPELSCEHCSLTGFCRINDKAAST